MLSNIYYDRNRVRNALEVLVLNGDHGFLVDLLCDAAAECDRVRGDRTYNVEKLLDALSPKLLVAEKYFD